VAVEALSMPSDSPGEDRIRAIVREEIARTGRSLLWTIIWSALSIVAALVGVQLLQLALFSPSLPVAVGFAVAGTVVVAASVWLLYLLHWQ